MILGSERFCGEGNGLPTSIFLPDESHRQRNLAGYSPWGGKELDMTERQFSSVAQSCWTLCKPMDCSVPGLPVHHQLLEPTPPHVHHIGDAIQPFQLCPLLLLLPSIFPSSRGFSNESALHIRYPKYWSFSFSISPCNEYSGLIPLVFDLLAVQGTLKSLLQHHSSKPSILWRSVFFVVQL